LKLGKRMSGSLLVIVLAVLVPALVSAQAQKGQFIIDNGIGFHQATVTRAQMGLVGFDLQGGKMITPNLLVGIMAGFDVVSFEKVGDHYKRFGVIPLLLKAKYFFNIGPRFQLHASVAGGMYTTVPHVGAEPIGSIWYATHKPGGSVGMGIDFWYLLIQGVGAEFEYHFFPSDEDEMFSYFSLRVNYSIIKF